MRNGQKQYTAELHVSKVEDVSSPHRLTDQRLQFADLINKGYREQKWNGVIIPNFSIFIRHAVVQ
jgi:hypothetical protein